MPSPASALTPLPLLNRLSIGLAVIALAILFYSPVRELAPVELDGANHSSYAYFTAHGYQYGTQVVTMAGPYGFVLYGWSYSGELFWERVVGQLILGVALGGLTVWFFRRHWRHPVAWLWLGAQLAFTPFHDDLLIEWTLLLGGLYLTQTPPEKRWSLGMIVVSALLALLSLIKGTQLALGLATVAVTLGAHLWQRQYRQAGVIAASFLLALVGLWLGAGQNPFHLPAYFRGALELAHGYNESMSVDEAPGLLLRGVLVCASLLAGLAWAAWQRRRDTVTLASLLLFAGHGFVQWKHGFVRADGHAYIFFHFAIVGGLVLFLIAHDRRSRPLSRVSEVVSAALALATVLACAVSDDPMLPNRREALSRPHERFLPNARQLLSLKATENDFAHRLQAQRETFSMPLTRREVRSGTIDVFGFEHSRVTLNGLNYQPRPMGGGPFNVYTGWLMRRNETFLRDPAQRPDFYLLNLQTIDERLLAQDDALSLIALAYLYEPVLMEHAHLLLRARPGATLPQPRRVSESRRQIGETFAVPEVGRDEILLARFDVRPSLLGRLRNFVYKVPRMRISRRGPDLPAVDSHRLVPVMASTPFILGPSVQDNRDFITLLAGRGGVWPRELRLSTSDRTWFQREFGVEFFALPRPSVAPGTDFDVLLHTSTRPLETVHTKSAKDGSPRVVRGQLLHAPYSHFWSLRGTEQSVTFGYGLVPGAYIGTDGVEFVVSVTRPAGGPPQELFRRLLRPMTQEGDRWQQEITLALPPLPPGSRLEIFAGTGPHNNSAYDWSYVSDLRFEDRPASP